MTFPPLLLLGLLQFFQGLTFKLSEVVLIFSLPRDLTKITLYHFKEHINQRFLFNGGIFLDLMFKLAIILVGEFIANGSSFSSNRELKISIAFWSSVPSEGSAVPAELPCSYRDLKNIFLKNSTTTLYTVNSSMSLTGENDIPHCSSWMCLESRGKDDRLITFMSSGVVISPSIVKFIDSGSPCGSLLFLHILQSLGQGGKEKKSLTGFTGHHRLRQKAAWSRQIGFLLRSANHVVGLKQM